jgi:hypothetical protein
MNTSIHIHTSHKTHSHTQLLYGCGGLRLPVRQVYIQYIHTLHTHVLTKNTHTHTALVWLWRCARPRQAFLPALLYCSNCAFLFGYHVHEKAALTAAVPMILLAVKSREYTRYTNMYVCMYACMHACMSVCMYVCMYVCMHLRMCIHRYM